VTPTLTISAPGPKGDQLLQVNITNSEAFAKLNLEVYKNNNLIKNLDYNIDPNGNFNSSNLIGVLDCPKVKYKVIAKLIDRAGNISQTTEKEVETLECSSCMGGNQIGWQNPIQDPRVRPTSGYRIPTRTDHDGLDMNVGQDQNKQTISGIPIYPAKPGTVTYARYNYTDSQRWTPNPNLPGKYLDTSNYVIIDHGNGYKTHYVHLMYENIPTVTIGQQVTTTTILGRMGNTGQSSGPHLHFGVFLNGVDKDPNLYINATGGDALDWQRPKWCRAVGEGNPEESETYKTLLAESFENMSENKGYYPFGKIETRWECALEITIINEIKQCVAYAPYLYNKDINALRRSELKEYALKLSDYVIKDKYIDDVTAMQFFYNRAGTYDQGRSEFVNDQSLVLSGRKDILNQIDIRYYVGGKAFKDEGFRDNFRDDSNQVYHSAGGLSAGYWLGIFGQIFITAHELCPANNPSGLFGTDCDFNLNGESGGSTNDLLLNIVMGLFGTELLIYTKNPADIGPMVENYINADSDDREDHWYIYHRFREENIV
jgi:murein DD-endopeptidase MepM/ murein hydrolase activator NlpD